MQTIMKNISTNKMKDKELKELHFDVQGWKSDLQYTEDDLLFMDKLLHSNAFRETTHNLFERLEDYKTKLKHVSLEKRAVQESIAQYEHQLGSMMGRTLNEYDPKYLTKHQALRKKIMDYTSGFKALKTELFNYAGGILR